MMTTDPEYSPDRRPIASRNHPLSIRAAKWLADAGVSPNAISVFGMLAGIAAGVAFAFTAHADFPGVWFIASAGFMQLRLLANMFDGMVAISTARASPVGSLYNEAPDRVSDAAILIGAGFALGGQVHLGYLAAIGALLTAYVRAQGAVAGAGQEFCGPMAKPQRMAVMTAAALYAALAPTAWQFHFSRMPELGVIGAALAIVVLGTAITSVRRLLRIARILRQKTE